MFSSCLVEVSDPGGPLQDTEPGEAEDAAFSGSESLEVYGIQVRGVFICDGCLGGVHDRAADAYDHGGGLDVHRLAFVQLLAHIEENIALREVHRESAVRFFEFHAAQGVQCDDPAFVKTDRSRTRLACRHGFAAAKARVFHDGAGLPCGVLDLHSSFVAEKTHRCGGVGLRSVDRMRKCTYQKRQSRCAGTESGEKTAAAFHR